MVKYNKKRYHSATRLVLVIMSIVLGVAFLFVVYFNVNDERIIAGLVGAFIAHLSNILGVFSGSQQPETSKSDILDPSSIHDDNQ